MMDCKLFKIKGQLVVGLAEPGAFTVVVHFYMHQVDLVFFVFVQKIIEHLQLLKGSYIAAEK